MVTGVLDMSPDDPDLNLLAGEILVGQHQWLKGRTS
jgi:hypothetical protein